MRVAILLALVAIVSACGSTRGLEAKGPSVGEVLANPPKAEPPPAAEEPIQTADAVGAYRRIEGTLPEAVDNQTIERRMADLGRRLGAEGPNAASRESYQAAIKRYEALLAQPDVRGREDILYHLAESYDALDDRGRTKRYLDRLIAEYPDSSHRIEAHFRRAELAFSANRFDSAAADYTFVVEQGASTAYWHSPYQRCRPGSRLRWAFARCR